MQPIERKLYRYGELRRLIREREQELQAVFTQKEEYLQSLLRAPSFEQERVMGGVMSDPTPNAVVKMGEKFDARILSMQNYIAELWSEYDELQRMIDRAGLDEREREYIELKYTKSLGSADIAEKAGYSESGIRNIKSNVLRTLSAVFRTFQDGKCGF